MNRQTAYGWFVSALTKPCPTAHPAEEMRADSDSPRADGAMGRPAESVVDQSMKGWGKSSASRLQAR